MASLGHEFLRSSVDREPTQAPSIRIQIFESASFSSHIQVFGESGIRIRNFLNPLSRLENFEYAMNPESHGRLIQIVLSNDVTRSSPDFYLEYFMKAAERSVIASLILGIISSLITCVQLNLPMINLHFNHDKRRVDILYTVHTPHSSSKTLRYGLPSWMSVKST